MITKIIHSVWLGGKEIPGNLRIYMDSWRQMMPTWDVRGWTEANIPVEVLPVPYVRQALEARKFAFVSDYIRLWALEQYGGVYMDTDVEVIRSFDDLPEFKEEFTNSHLADARTINSSNSSLYVGNTSVVWMHG